MFPFILLFIIMNEEETIQNYEESDIDYTIIVKNINDIILDADFDNEDDALICESIITNLENTAADAIRDMKTVSIPFIGCVRIDPVKRKLRDKKLHLSIMRKNMTKENYKDYIRDTVAKLKEEQQLKDAKKLFMVKVRRANKKKYEDYYKRLGRPYAELFIAAMSWLAPVEHDEEFEEYYKSLNN